MSETRYNKDKKNGTRVDAAHAALVPSIQKRTYFLSQKIESEGYDHLKWLKRQRRPCPRCGEGVSMMQIANAEEAAEELASPVNGFKYKVWPFYHCAIHNIRVAI